MVFNVFVVKKWAGLFLAGFLPALAFLIGNAFYGFWFALIFLGGGFLVGGLVANLLLRNPFRELVEGKGLLVLDLNSTGILRPFIFGIDHPYIKGRIGKDDVVDAFDRDTVKMLSRPVVCGDKAKFEAKESSDDGESELVFRLDEKKYNESRFALFHYPVLLYNAQMRSFLTKDWLSDKEKSGFAEHGVLYLNRKMEELTSAVRDFGRHVVELTKPKAGLFSSKWTWIIILGFVVLLIILFAPKVWQTVVGNSGTISGAFETAGRGATVG